jgi:hypothetical protein
MNEVAERQPVLDRTRLANAEAFERRVSGVFHKSLVAIDVSLCGGDQSDAAKEAEGLLGYVRY